MKTLNRRTVLKGLGTALALPFLEMMDPPMSLGAGKKARPRRLAFVYVPNGVDLAHWKPAEEGKHFTLPSILQPLEPFQKEILVLGGLTLDMARPGMDGGGDHARAMAAFLTGKRPKKTLGTDLQAGVSADQLAAEKMGKATRFPSLEVGADVGQPSGNCDPGYSCAYTNNLSWKTEAMPVTKEVNPRLIFERLFGGPDKKEADSARAKKEKYKLSILDFVAQDAARLKGRLGKQDQRKLEEYLTSVREVETRISRSQDEDKKTTPNLARPLGIPRDYQEHIRLITDLLVLAFQGDLTRVVTFVYANEARNQGYGFLGIPEGHHELTHHGGNQEKLEKVRKINHFHVGQFAYLLEKLQSIKEGDGALLDQCMIVYGSGISDGNAHSHGDLPILLAGKGGGSITPGKCVQFKKETPLMNLHLALLDRMGVAVSSFGDSTGKLEL